MHALLLVAVAGLLVCLGGREARAEPRMALTGFRMGHLVAVDRTWLSVETGGLRLCLLVENRGPHPAYEAAVWAEFHGGDGPQMRRLGLHRSPLDPSTLEPGQAGAVCLDPPAEIRGIFVRLRARWPRPVRPAPPGRAFRPPASRSGAE